MCRLPDSRTLAWGWLLLVAALLMGCAISNRDNRKTMNKLDEWVQPKSMTGRIVFAPVAIPVGTAAGLTDMLVVHPISVIPDAADDVYELYWKPRKMDFLRKTLIFPFCVIATPPTFVLDWLFRSIFDVSDPEDESVHEEEAAHEEETDYEEEVAHEEKSDDEEEANP